MLEPGCTLIPYNINAIRDADTIYVVEGMMDVAAMTQSGFATTISLANGYQTKMETFKPYLALFKGKRIVFAGDCDEPGIEARKGFADYFCGYDLWLVDWTRYQAVDGTDFMKDANDVLKAGGEEAVRQCIAAAIPMPIEDIVTIDDDADALSELIEYGMPKFPGIMLRKFSNMVCFEPGRAMIVSGYPGAGKTSFADFVMMQLAVTQGWRAAVFSPEKYPTYLHYIELGQMLMGGEFTATNLDAETIERGKDFLRKNIFHISDVKTSIEDILNTAEKLVKLKDIRVLVIDPFAYIDTSTTVGATETEKIKTVLLRIIGFSRTYKVFTIVVAHPKKPQDDSKGKEPSLYDIAGSANFYNLFDYGLILQRQESNDYTKRNPLTWIHVLKIRFRHLGYVGKCAVGYDTETGRFVSVADDNVTMLPPDRSDWTLMPPSQDDV